MAQRFGSDGMDQRAIGGRQSLRRAVQRQFERIAPPQHCIEQPERGAACGKAGDSVGMGL